MFSPLSRKLTGDIVDRNPDVVVVGTGIAGLQTALSAAAEGAQVLLISAGAVDHSNSLRAQGGIAAAVGDDDDIALHEQDTYTAGRGICRPSAVKMLVADAPARIEDLRRLGVDFEDDLGLEGGHSRNRIVHAGGASTGAHVARALATAAIENPDIEIRSGLRVRGLWVEDGECFGVLTGEGPITARATVLATGGAGGLWAHTTNAPTATGGGIAAAYRAGAEIADMELTQFHPTTLAGSSLLLTEALRGAGATLLDAAGERFIDELAPRDVVARAINAQAGQVTLDLRSIDRSRFAELMGMVTQESGIDPATTPVPVSPAAHYFIGGIVTDLDGRSNIERLYAAGECTTTGVHGANRLASNSLLECLVFGRRAGIATSTLGPVRPPATTPDAPTLEPQPDEDLKDALWQHAGLVRNAEGLRSLLEAPHTVVRLIAQAGLIREESRGVHYREDFPEQHDEFARHIVQRVDADPELVEWR